MKNQVADQALESMIASYMGNADVMSYVNAVIIPNSAQAVGLPQSLVDMNIRVWHRMMIETFGGATILSGEGGWIDALGVVVPDNVSIILSFSSELTEKMIFDVTFIAMQVNRDFNQDCVGLVLNNKFRLMFKRLPQVE